MKHSEEYTAWLKSLKAGDEVMVCYRCFADKVEPMFLRPVLGVTKTGRIRVQRYAGSESPPVEYNPDGSVRGERSFGHHVGDFEWTEIHPATEERKEELRRILAGKKLDQWRREIRQTLVSGIRRDHANNFTDEQLRTVEAILKETDPVKAAKTEGQS